MKRKLVWGAAIGVVYGAVGGWLLATLDASVGLAEAILLAPYAGLAAWVVHCRRARRRAPQRFREIVQRHTDADAGPPAGSEPVDEPVVRHWYAADAREDWRALADLLAPDFRLISVARGRPIKRWVVVRLMRNGAKWLGESENELLETLADPSERDVVWVKEHTVQRPPDGGELRYGTWERWTLTGDRERIRTIEVVAYTAPPVPV
jgi:hypothetical protein